MHFLSYSQAILVLAGTVIASSQNPPAAAQRRDVTASGPTATPTVIGKPQVLLQVPFQACPEQLGRPKKQCSDCGGDTKQAGFCDTILLNGPQENCQQEGCGVYCQCERAPDEPGRPVPTAQIPFQICPEMVNKPKKQCSDCGGDSKQAGVCDNILISGDQRGCPPQGCGYYCGCSAAGGTTTAAPAGPTHLVTTVVDGQTITGTFTATTISGYESLKASTTITTTEDGKETALAILAGGVAWWLVAQSGGAAAILTPPPELPDGAEEDDPSCPKPKEDCKDCDGNSLGLCTSKDGGCPCDQGDECPTGDDEPECTATTCQGDDSGKCTIDPHKGCSCKKDQCPTGDDQPKCDADDCKGDDSNKCTLDPNKGCDCGEETEEAIDTIETVDYTWLILQQGLLDQVISGSPDTPGDSPASHPTCTENSASKVPEKMSTDDGDVDPNTLLYRIRETLCDNKCEAPQGIPQNVMAATADGDGCEIAIALPDKVEAFAYRSVNSLDQHWQQCWDSLANITETCVKQGPNKGSVAGPDDNESFQAGFRPLNDAGAKHPDLPGGDDVLKDAANCVGEGQDAGTAGQSACCMNFVLCPKSNKCAEPGQSPGAGNPCEKYDGATPAPKCQEKPACDRCGGGGSDNTCQADKPLPQYQGCACDPKPTCGDTKPKCDACHGQNGFCTYAGDASQNNANCACDDTPTVVTTTKSTSTAAPAPAFTSICGKGDGACQSNGCAGVWYICTDGKYKGCNCNRDSRFSQNPGPVNNPMTCGTDCCIGKDIYSQDWCSANCGGITSCS
ncbi:MAG: hypothetical protein M4579_003466 [Chaenotheca gracillima]|nr:MAG: hypothetical protein M4579_003466 [Chaenotheca gracillima]